MVEQQGALSFGESAAFWVCRNPNPRMCLAAKTGHIYRRQATLTYGNRPGRFYCRGCGRELFEYQGAPDALL